jgi:hypothetical protein
MEKKEIVLNNFDLIDEKLFVQYASISHMYKVNKFQAILLNTKYGINICWCSLKRDDGEVFNSYLANLGYGKNENIIGAKLFQAIHSVFKELEPNFGGGNN